MSEWESSLKYSSFCSPRLHPACPISSSVQVHAGRPLPSRTYTSMYPKSLLLLTPSPSKEPHYYLDFRYNFHSLRFFLLSTSFPKTMFSNLSMLFQHLCVTVKEVIQQGQEASLEKFGKAHGNNTLAVLLQGYPVQLEWQFPLTQRWTLNTITLTFYY